MCLPGRAEVGVTSERARAGRFETEGRAICISRGVCRAPGVGGSVRSRRPVRRALHPRMRGERVGSATSSKTERGAPLRVQGGHVAYHESPQGAIWSLLTRGVLQEVGEPAHSPCQSESSHALQAGARGQGRITLVEILDGEWAVVGWRAVKERIGPVSAMVRDDVHQKGAVRTREQLGQTNDGRFLETIVSEQACLELDGLPSDRDVGAARPEDTNIPTVCWNVAARTDRFPESSGTVCWVEPVGSICPPLVAMPTKLPRRVLRSAWVAHVVVTSFAVAL